MKQESSEDRSARWAVPLAGNALPNILQLFKARSLWIAVLLVVVVLGSGFVGAKLGAHYEIDQLCCQLTPFQSFVVTGKERLGLVTFYSQIGQDKWVSEKVFPGVKNGFFLDVGSGDGTFNSNTKTLEQKGWTGICVDPHPQHMEDRTCQMFKEVVYSEAGKKVRFWRGGFWGGIADTLEGEAKRILQTAPFEEFTTVTLADILQRGKAPQFINFVSLDIEGGEVNALKGFPFDKYRMGALAVEHNYQEPKRSEIKDLMESHGYKRVHTSIQDDFYVPANS